MPKPRIMLEVLIDLDHTPENARDWLQAILLSSIGNYNPVVLIAEPK